MMCQGQAGTPEGMVRVVSGMFIMGARSEERVTDPESPEIVYLGSACPQREICLSDYCIDQYR